MKLLTTPVLALCVAIFTLPVSAQDINLLPEGQTLITLSVTERVSVEQDTLIATLRIDVRIETHKLCKERSMRQWRRRSTSPSL